MSIKVLSFAAMYSSFLSIVSVLHTPGDARVLPEFLRAAWPVLQDNFSDFEIILVNNCPEMEPGPFIEPLDPALKQNIYLLNLSSHVNRNHAVLAGLDRANGDYVVIFELGFYRHPDILTELFAKTREGFDIVYLRSANRPIQMKLRPFYKTFYYILRHYSDLKVDEKAHDTRIISRRALNSLLRLRENLRYMKAIYSIVGYSTAALDTELSPEWSDKDAFSERFRTSLVAITSYTTFLRTLLLWIFLFSLGFLILVIINALKVKFTGMDFFGKAAEPFPGWTFLVVLISIFFATTCLNLYIMSIYLSNIYNEIKQRPLYIIESIKRF
ncbi:MAG: glycosyltransferase [Saprospiraceae bacterium]|nr:glycosyltransferase [Saprospiraceae bacterium]